VESKNDTVKQVSPRWHRAKAAVQNAALAAFSFGVALAGAEGAVRIVAPQQLILIRPDLWQPADTVGWLRRPNVNVKINTGERTVTVATDSGGFRVHPDGAVVAGAQVLLLGDSFMEALQVDYEHTVGGLLEASLPMLVDQPVAVRNAAVGGWDPDQYALLARSLLARDKYDLVITSVYVGNDIIGQRRTYLPPRAPVERHPFRIPRAAGWSEFTNAILLPLNDFLEVRSHLFLFFKNRLKSVRMRFGLSPLEFPPQFLRSEANSARWDVTADILEDISRTAEGHGVAALFVLVPTKFQVDSADLGSYVEGYSLDPASFDLEQPNRRLLEEMKTRGLSVLDALPHFRRAFNEGAHPFGRIDHHLSPEGHAIVAELITPFVAQALDEIGRKLNSSQQSVAGAAGVSAVSRRSA
jgi:hypothetical protein